MRNKVIVSFMLMFCLLICLAGTAAADGVYEFSDTKVHWAEETIARSAPWFSIGILRWNV